MNPKVNSGFREILMSPCRFIIGKKEKKFWLVLLTMGGVYRQIVYETSLYLPLDFVVELL